MSACCGLAGACDRESSPAGAQQGTVSPGASDDSPPTATGEVSGPVETREAAAHLEPEAVPAWEAVPIDLPLVGRPSEIGGGAASSRAALVVYRIDVEGKEACAGTGQPACHAWVATVRPRGGTPTEAVSPLRFAESDTPSGIAIDAVVALAGGGFAVVWREGRYAGDAPRLTVSFVTDDGAAWGEPVELLSAPWVSVEAAAATAQGSGSVLVCWTGLDGGKAGIAQLREQPLGCRTAAPGRAPGGFFVVGSGPGLRRAPALAWRGVQGLLTWVRAGGLEGVLLGPDGAQESDVLPLGPSLARSARVSAGHGGYLVVWQSGPSVVGAGDSRSAVLARRVERDGGLGPRVELSGQDLEYVRLDPVSAVPSGFVVTGRPDDRARLLVVHPDGRGWTPVPVTAGQGQHLLGVSGGLLELGAEAPSRVVFRDAFSVTLGAAPPGAGSSPR